VTDRVQRSHSNFRKAVAGSGVVACWLFLAACVYNTPKPVSPEFENTFTSWSGEPVLLAGYWSEPGKPFLGTFVAAEDFVYFFVPPVTARWAEPKSVNLRTKWEYLDIVRLERFGRHHKIQIRHATEGDFDLSSQPFITLPDVVGNVPTDEAIAIIRKQIERRGSSVEANLERWVERQERKEAEWKRRRKEAQLRRVEEAKEQADPGRLKQLGTIGVWATPDLKQGIRSPFGQVDPVGGFVGGTLQTGDPVGMAAAVVVLPYFAALYHLRPTVRKSKRALKKILSETPVYKQIRDGIVESAAGPNISIIGVDESDTGLGYEALHERGLDTLVHITGLWIGLIGIDNEGEIDSPNAGFHMTAKVRFIRPGDKSVIREEDFTYTGAPREFETWSADEGLKLRGEVQSGRDYLITEIAVALLQLDPSESLEKMPQIRRSPAENRP